MSVQSFIFVRTSTCTLQLHSFLLRLAHSRMSSSTSTTLLGSSHCNCSVLSVSGPSVWNVNSVYESWPQSKGIHSCMLECTTTFWYCGYSEACKLHWLREHQHRYSLFFSSCIFTQGRAGTADTQGPVKAPFSCVRFFSYLMNFRFAISKPEIYTTKCRTSIITAVLPMTTLVSLSNISVDWLVSMLLSDQILTDQLC